MLKNTFSDTIPNMIRPLGKSLWILFMLTKKKILRTDEKILATYRNKNKVMKLHIGCGDHLLEGWLNTDLDPVSNTIFHLNATWKFPFNNDMFDYVFSEHMIEHISYIQGRHMLAESFQVLKPNGKVRITTPDLAFLVGIYQNKQSVIQNEYIEWYNKEFIGATTLYKEPFVINSSMRLFGHQFIYDENTLRESFEKTGFINIKRYSVGESDNDELNGLENEAVRPPGFLRLESIVLEGTKP